MKPNTRKKYNSVEVIISRVKEIKNNIFYSNILFKNFEFLKEKKYLPRYLSNPNYNLIISFFLMNAFIKKYFILSKLSHLTNEKFFKSLRTLYLSTKRKTCFIFEDKFFSNNICTTDNVINIFFLYINRICRKTMLEYIGLLSTEMMFFTSCI